MLQPLILSIETATTACSVCLTRGGEAVAIKELNNGYSHSENLHVFIDVLLKTAGVKPADLNAIAVSKGPGSYTGLRIGVSAAKGLCYALGIPLIAVNTLQGMAFGMMQQQKKPNALYCPMLDARRMEVYCAMYDAELNEVMPTSAKIIDEKTIPEFSKGKEVFFFGDGAEKCKELIAQIPQAVFIPSVYPSASNMITLSLEGFTHGRFEDVAYFEPFYLKEFFSKH